MGAASIPSSGTPLNKACYCLPGVYALARPLLFALSPHAAHALANAALAPVEHVAPVRALVRALCAPGDPRLAVRTMGLVFPSPLGVAGGFDKNALRARALAALGFGSVELGTVTAQAQRENPRPNLFRLEADRALVNRLGFPNEGASAVCARIAAWGVRGGCGVPVGVSIGKSRAVPLDPIEGAIADYAASFREAKRVADFVVVNVSSPNTKDLRAMQGADVARALLAELTRANAEPRVPILLKVAPDLSDADLEALLAVVEEAKLDGVVATNTTIARAGLSTAPRRVEAIGAGGLSGPPLRARALEVVSRVRARLGSGPTVVGVGGVERADDVIALVRAGANLAQMYTGFVYGGPLVARSIARELSRRMDEAGASSVAELAGLH
jgi:dihydroorotate dehydrogenase